MDTPPQAPPECFLLTRLPGELRALIYTHILTFPLPLKLRQIVAGSPNTSILRTNRQIHHEALPIFYSANTILATRNDFCSLTDSDLQTPLRKDQLRHLLVRNCSQSIRCSSYSGGGGLVLEGCCGVCRPDARGWVEALAGLGRLRSVVVDYSRHAREFAFILESIRKGSWQDGTQLICTDVARFKLVSPTLPPGLEITFADLPLHTIWAELSALHSERDPGDWTPPPGTDAVLRRLREEGDANMVNMLYHLIDSRPLAHEGFFMNKLWKHVDDLTAAGASEVVRGEALERLTEGVVAWTRNDHARLAAVTQALGDAT